MKQLSAVSDVTLKKAGCDTGTAVNLRVLPDCLIVTARPPSAEPKVMLVQRQAVRAQAAADSRVYPAIAGPQNRQG